MAHEADREALIRLQQEWMQAWIRGDRNTLEAILADGFTLTSVTTDDLVDRATWLKSLGRVVGKEFHYDSFDVRVFGDAAVVKSRARQKAEIDGKPWEGEFLLTDVWIRSAGRWQVVARHASRPTKVSTAGRMGAAR